MVAWLSLSHHTWSHLFLQCLKHIPSDWAQVLAPSMGDDVTASSTGIFTLPWHSLAHGKQEQQQCA